MLICIICGTDFPRKGTRGPVPQFCSAACKSKKARQRPERKTYERNYRRARRATGALRAYESAYNRRPDVIMRNRLRWRNENFYGLEVAPPYSGHRWLDMARAATLRGKDLDGSAPWADDYYDEMGEAVLALLEGRDMGEAVKSYRSKEYPTRKLNIHLGDWRDDDGPMRWFEAQLPTMPSAEDEYLDNDEVQYYTAERFDDVSTGSRGRRMHHATSTPTNRRSNKR